MQFFSFIRHKDKSDSSISKEAALREDLAAFFVNNIDCIVDKNVDERRKIKYNRALNELCGLELSALLNPARPILYRLGDITSFLAANLEAVRIKLLLKGIRFNYLLPPHPCYIAFEPRLLQVAIIKAIWLAVRSGAVTISVIGKISENNIMINISADSPIDDFLKKPLSLSCARAVKLLNRNVKVHKGALIRSKNHIGFSIHKKLEKALTHNVSTPCQPHGMGLYSEETAKKILSDSLSPVYYIFGI